MNTQRSTLSLALILLLSGLFTQTSGQWLKHIIDDNLNTAVTVDTADLDGDSRFDLVVNSFSDGDIFWYQNDYPSWIKHTVDDSATRVTEAWCVDLDGDNTADIIACISGDNQITWYENNHPTWTKHQIDRYYKPESVRVSDINNDGRSDVLTIGNIIDGGDVVWYENAYPDWIKHIIYSGSEKWGPYVSDIDGDGMSDLLVTMADAKMLVWFKSEDNGMTWTKKDTIDDDLLYPWGTNSGDINGDGMIDFVLTTGGPYQPGGSVVWYENQYPSWTKHVIDANLRTAAAVAIQDMNDDGMLDVVATATKADSIVWYENNHPAWTKHIIDDNIRGPRSIKLVDMNGDGFDDVLAATQFNLVWYRNPMNTVYAESLEVTPYSLQTSEDTLMVRADLHNPEYHSMNVFAVIEGEQSHFVDTLTLFDDGVHTDGDPSDHVWANVMVMTGFPEDVYEVFLVAYDSATGVSDYLKPEQFINFGPVSFENYSITSSHHVFSPGDWIDVKIKLRNNSTTAVATNIRVQLLSLAPNLLVTQIPVGIGDIAPGESLLSDGTIKVKITDTSLVKTHLPIAVNIFHGQQKCWSDTLEIYVHDEQPVYIPDTVFLNALIEEGVDTNGDSLIGFEEAEAITSLDVSSKWLEYPFAGRISDMSGIEAFINLDSLSCIEPDVASLDLSTLVGLKYLETGIPAGPTGIGCGLTSLDLSNNTELETLLCHGNHGLTSLNISKNTYLKVLDVGCCYSLTNLDISNNTMLEVVCCHANYSMTSLNISNNIYLQELDANGNGLTSLDISNNTALKSIDLGGNPYLKEVCVWTIPFPPEGVEVSTDDSVYFRDCAAPYVTAPDTVNQPDFMEVTVSEDGVIYLVHANTGNDIKVIRGVCIDSLDAVSNTPVNIPIAGLDDGNYWLYARDSTGNLSEPKAVTLIRIVLVTGVTLDQHTLHLQNGQTAALAAIISPPDATDPLVDWWSDDDAVAAVNENGEVTARSIDSTYIHVSTNDGGYMDSCQVIVTAGTGVIQSQGRNYISIYPNPVNGLLNIQSGSIEIQQVDISSVAGQILHSFKMDQTIYQINLSSFQKGIYFITIRSEDFVTTRKIIKL